MFFATLNSERILLVSRTIHGPSAALPLACVHGEDYALFVMFFPVLVAGPIERTGT